jgi:hypothetical protein
MFARKIGVYPREAPFCCSAVAHEYYIQLERKGIPEKTL